ncbi:hypothetical protein BDW60DRAFT_190186 [Aspergillus nidulans var. acristatus]
MLQISLGVTDPRLLLVAAIQTTRSQPRRWQIKPLLPWLQSATAWVRCHSMRTKSLYTHGCKYSVVKPNPNPCTTVTQPQSMTPWPD